MKLSIPPEPKDIQLWMKSLEEKLEGSSIDWSSYVAWDQNKLPKYLWDHWKIDLKETGLTWQSFMKLLRLRTDNILLWYKGHLSWDSFIDTIKELIKSPLGQEIQK